MKEDNAVYIRCRNCGKYVEENQSINRIFCSPECTEAYLRCPNCGRFFLKSEDSGFGEYCSIECKTLYNDEGIIIPAEENKSE